MKEIECDVECGKFYSSIRSAIWSTTVATQHIIDMYKRSPILKPTNHDAAIEKLVEEKIIEWLKLTEENCYINGE